MSEATLVSFGIREGCHAQAGGNVNLYQVDSRPACSAHEFLREYPSRAYTTLVTTKAASAVPQYIFHVQRLQRSAAAIHGQSPPPLENVLQRGILIATTALSSDSEAQLIIVLAPPARETRNYSDDGPEQLVSKTVDCNAHDWKIMIHAKTIVPPLKDDYVVVEARGTPRKQAFAKNTAWVHQRRNLERTRGENVSETILLSDTGEGSCTPENLTLLEGLVTNFFVLMSDGSLWTASEHDQILNGSVRKIVLEAARNRGMTIRERAPCVKDRHMFAGAFITNAVRVISPISQLRFPTLKHCDAVNLPWPEEATSVIELLASDTRRIMDEGSTSLMAKP